MRVKTGIVRRRKHKKVLRAAKGFRGASGDVIKQAKQATMRAAAYSTRDRKVTKRRMRQLWIIRINTADHINRSEGAQTAAASECPFAWV